MGDANKEIAFGAVAAGAMGGLAVGGVTKMLDKSTSDAVAIGSVAALVTGALATAYLWRLEKTPGSWANPIVTEAIPSAAPDGAMTSTATPVLANTVPATPLGTTVAIFEVLGTVGAAVAAVSIIYDWQKKATT